MINLGFDLKFLGPQLERGVTALESIAESLLQLRKTAALQEEILAGGHRQREPEPALHSVLPYRRRV